MYFNREAPPSGSVNKPLLFIITLLYYYYYYYYYYFGT